MLPSGSGRLKKDEGNTRVLSPLLLVLGILGIVFYLLLRILCREEYYREKCCIIVVAVVMQRSSL